MRNLNKIINSKATKITGLTLAAFALCTTAALAMAVPAADDLGYDVYTIFMDIKDGPIGYAGAGIGIAGAAFLGYKSQWLPCVGALLGTGAIVKANTIVESLGALIG